MNTSRSQMRQSLHIRIDPSPYDSEVIISPDSASPSPLSGWVSAGTARTTPTSGSSEQDEFPVLCMYDFQGADADQLSFRKNEILIIVKQENTGWWAAMRKGGDVIGWVPKAFVNHLTEEMAERLSAVREELRVYEYDAEQLYSAPISRNNPFYDPDPEPEQVPRPFRVPLKTVRSLEHSRQDHRPQEQTSRNRINLYPSSLDARRTQVFTPPSPTTPMPQPPNRLTKPTPPTPNDDDDTSHGSRPSAGLVRSPSVRRRPLIDVMRPHPSPDLTGPFTIPMKRAGMDGRRGLLPAGGYLEQVLVLQASVPRYLQPRFEDQLEVDTDGQVRRGSVPALLEKVIRTNADGKHFQDIFLMTFRTFMTADALFDALVEYYHAPQPEGLTPAEVEDWEERGRLRTQRKVLEIFTDWLQRNYLLQEEPHIAGRLTEFLQSITTGSNAKVSRLIQERIKTLTFSIGSPVNVSPSTNLKKSKKPKPLKPEFLKIEPGEIAEQLSVIQFESYSKITPHECIAYTKSQKATNVANLREFCAWHDKVGHWVQTSILTNETMKKRADTVDHWIKVAEKCRSINNIVSMSAIINALSSTVIMRLPLTWAHVNRKSNLDALLRFHDPVGGFASYRTLNSGEGPCVPLINMYLTDLAHIHDQYSDKESQICFHKRKRFYEVVSTILRHQNQPYPPALDELVVFIRHHLQEPPKDSGWFWSKSHEVQQSELEHADIRKGLEKAGF